MHTHTSRLVRGGVLLVALVVSVCMFVSSTDRAEAQIDISGDWTFTVLAGGGPFLDCTATITQAGTGLSMAMDCTSSQGFQGGTISFHSRDLRGTIDTATGDISMSGTLTAAVGGANPLALDVRGTVSPDGNSMSGSWTSPGGSGTFDGVRQSASPPAATVATAAPVPTPSQNGGSPSAGGPVAARPTVGPGGTVTPRPRLRPLPRSDRARRYPRRRCRLNVRRPEAERRPGSGWWSQARRWRCCVSESGSGGVPGAVNESAAAYADAVGVQLGRGGAAPQGAPGVYLGESRAALPTRPPREVVLNSGGHSFGFAQDKPQTPGSGAPPLCTRPFSRG
jgi:hypothetical protein